jgi:NAD+ kinase
LKIAVYSSSLEKQYLEVYQRLFSFLEKHGIGLVLSEEIFCQLNQECNIEPEYHCLFSKTISLCSGIDLMLSIGGDGTFLDAVSHTLSLGIPVAGINCGRLGFLADINSENLEEALEQFLRGEYTLEYRSLLQLVEPEGLFGHCPFAMNDLTMHKLDNSSMIKIEAFINNDFLANYWADGLIISTPTGSTAYSLSVGGPIVTPNLEGLIITPIASHHLTVRPVVVPDEVEITLNIEGRGNQFLIACDHRSEPLDFSTQVKVRKAKFSVPVLRLNGQSFYSTLRNKLMWAADKRNT